ncbi:hypothetical protein [Vibrio sp. CAU 1672]|uniref:hypothetical protein n=1 Tax=Vibrio sp. CAU 1672 TaxID=3032594 RepID=UPI0023D9BFE5|nr:hypothetical protein [Vibrio sp. CAU 1672]MDF2154955.1 hypothetical protein [Vibrio sp. CAU 1672]
MEKMIERELVWFFGLKLQKTLKFGESQPRWLLLLKVRMTDITARPGIREKILSAEKGKAPFPLREPGLEW